MPSSPFRDEAERLRAREAFLKVTGYALVQAGAGMGDQGDILELLTRDWDRLYPVVDVPEKVHTESTCQECGGENPVWHAPHALWNRVMGTPSNPRGEGVIVCPTCFLRTTTEKMLQDAPTSPSESGLVPEREALDPDGGAVASEAHPTLPDFDAKLDAYRIALQSLNSRRPLEECEAMVLAARQRVRDLHEAVVREREALVPLARVALLIAGPFQPGVTQATLTEEQKNAARKVLAKEAP